ncbi:MAG: hypothetical protein COV01_01480 [Candidatus Taylorbacteria bacterium CG10_big_fil_rev_8_21_14_0_10_41_48]|uniref:Uncharacterized protein n=1 Tax=Candidatus Taylorbacteria bacterium CG10_big_fil_rev_8_21_14_0_10_41_48 TaxID=1975024 RepID=A0A2M8LCJ3_9BACT|nr:MAG: hypothetical protein COV01_01480 [Candidatus Taylorbacteria bacterium CG10_big_fil_rev_8_21_14_0_10_41_48]
MSKIGNNDIFNSLEILDEYAHMAPRKALHVVKAVMGKKPMKPSATRLKGFGKIYGKTHDDLLVECTKVLGKIRYLETRGVMKLLEKLVAQKNKQVKNDALKGFENLAQYNLFVLQQIEYKTQEQILNEIEGWSNRRLLKNSEIVITIAKELLTPTFEGHSMPDYKTFTLHSGPLVVTFALKTIRKRTISLLKKLYGISNDLASRTKILQAFQSATQTPHSHLYGEDLEQMVWEATNSVIDIYLDILSKAENEIIQDIEEQKIWFIRRFEKKHPTKLSELDEAIKSNSSYGMFRVFVGYDGRLDPEFDYNRDRETRSQKVDEFVSDLSDSNFDGWRKRILSVVKNHAVSEQGSYGYFEVFLTKLAEKKPALAIRLIEENEKEIAPFLISLLLGLWKSDLKKAKELISHWVDEGKYLYTWAFIFVVVDDFDELLFKNIISKAKDEKDARALNNGLRSLLHHYPKNKHLKSIFIDLIKILNSQKNTWWVDNLWFKGDSILNDLTEDDWKTIFNGLLLLPNIDYQAEEILKFVADKHPEKVIAFFHTRVEIKSKKRRGIDDRYDGVPFNFHKLGEALRHHAVVIVPILLSWYADGGNKHNWLFRWEASHLFEEIFPGLNPVVEQVLISQVKKETKNSRDIVFSVLSKYKGGSHLWGVVKALIKQYSKSKEYKEVRDHLFGYLTQTGVVTGEDGFVRAYESKKTEIQDLKNDSDKSIRKFATEYEAYLNDRITFEQKRTNEQIELMKRGLN